MDGALFIFYQQFVDYGQLAKVIILLQTVSNVCPINNFNELMFIQDFAIKAPYQHVV